MKVLLKIYITLLLAISAAAQHQPRKKRADLTRKYTKRILTEIDKKDSLSLCETIRLQNEIINAICTEKFAEDITKIKQKVNSNYTTRIRTNSNS